MNDPRHEAAYVVKTIAAFLAGSGGEWDWDNFSSRRLRDHALDDIRRRALAVELPFDEEGEATLRYLQAEAETIMGEGNQRRNCGHSAAT